MNQSQLEQYTKDAKHHGSNEKQVLSHFLLYALRCNDPLNVYRYMEEKVICTFLPAFWLNKAHYLAECGDYRNCFECLVEARSRNGIEDQDQQASQRSSEIQIDYETQEYRLWLKLETDMKKFPLKSKRSIEEFKMMNEIKNTEERKAKLLELYENKYSALLRQKEREDFMKRQKLPKSWLYQKYQQENIIELRIGQKVHENSVKQAKEVRYHSMHTPIKVRDPHRLTKAMDSVQILKRKRSTREKSRKQGGKVEREEEDDDDEEENYTNQMANSLPVGNKFVKLRRRVTFQMKSGIKISKIRSTQSIETNLLLDLNLNSKTPKIEENELQDNQSHEQQKSVSFNTTPFPSK